MYAINVHITEVVVGGGGTGGGGGGGIGCGDGGAIPGITLSTNEKNCRTSGEDVFTSSLRDEESGCGLDKRLLRRRDVLGLQ